MDGNLVHFPYERIRRYPLHGYTGPAQILIFTGVRIERSESDVESQSAKPKRLRRSRQQAVQYKDE
jgi:hypothetical protein